MILLILESTIELNNYIYISKGNFIKEFLIQLTDSQLKIKLVFFTNIILKFTKINYINCFVIRLLQQII